MFGILFTKPLFINRSIARQSIAVIQSGVIISDPQTSSFSRDIMP